jgi:hypothetical protein
MKINTCNCGSEAYNQKIKEIALESGVFTSPENKLRRCRSMAAAIVAFPVV